MKLRNLFTLRTTKQSHYCVKFDLGQISETLLMLACSTLNRIKGVNMFEKIVVGFDGSPESENATRLACELAKKYDSEIHLVHTPHPQIVAFAMGAVTGYHAATTMPSSEDVEKACNKIVNSANAIAEQYNQKITQVYTERGDAAEQIIA